MDSPAPTTLRILLLGLLLLAHGAAAAPLFEASVFQRTVGIDTLIRSAGGPDGALVSNADFTFSHGGSVVGSASATGGVLRVAVRGETQGTGFSGFHNPVGVRGIASLFIDDLVFSGPDAEVSTTFSLDFDGRVTSSDEGEGTAGLLAELTGSLNGSQALFSDFTGRQGVVDRQLTSGV